MEMIHLSLTEIAVMAFALPVAPVAIVLSPALLVLGPLTVLLV